MKIVIDHFLTSCSVFYSCRDAARRRKVALYAGAAAYCYSAATGSPISGSKIPVLVFRFTDLRGAASSRSPDRAGVELFLVFESLAPFLAQVNRRWPEKDVKRGWVQHRYFLCPW